MKNFILIFCIIFCAKGFSQNIKCETTDYVKIIDGKEYSTFQYINASYSFSRPAIILITDKEIFMKVHQKIPIIFNAKQEYTDVFLLGIKGFNKDRIDNVDNKIIDSFINNAEKYRKDNNLIQLDKTNISSQIHYLTKVDDICKYLVCRK